jgi:glutamate N-acetyltransferase/amino-acid N-acetyltransferase
LNLPLGYQYSALYAGIRKAAQDDLGLIFSNRAAWAAGVFTQNRVQAAPVVVCKNHLQKSRGLVRAVLVNAGNANCATRTGEAVATVSAKAVAEQFEAPVEQILPASTGVIGVELDPDLIIGNVQRLVNGLADHRFEDVARAIMTTDTVMKTSSREVKLEGGAIRIAGMTKGSGMIQPNMATTLGFVMTDADIGPSELRAMLADAVEYSYNRISVDGDTSTNDTVLLLANGASGLAPDESGRELVREALRGVMEDLAKKIARDGEGARKLISIQVRGAKNETDAQRIARFIANSPLVKTAIAGSDPNWGRILSAAGNAGVEFDPLSVDIEMQGVPVCRGGFAAEFSEPELKRKLDDHDCVIRFNISGRGKGEAHFWTCDFTEKYIEINASYRT